MVCCRRHVILWRGALGANVVSSRGLGACKQAATETALARLRFRSISHLALGIGLVDWPSAGVGFGARRRSFAEPRRFAARGQDSSRRPS